MKDGDHGCGAISPFETERNEEQHTDQGCNRDRDRLSAQLLAGDLANGVGPFDLVRSFRIPLQTLGGFSFCPKVIQRFSYLVASGVYAGLTLASLRFLKALMRHSDKKPTFLIQNLLDEGILNSRFTNSSANVLD